jgi:phage gpG-like protein
MAAEITWDAKEVTKQLQQILANVQSIKNGVPTFLKLLSVVTLRDIDQHFKDESGPQGKWKEWSESYRQSLIKAGRKVKGAKGNSKKKGGFAKILQMSGRMRNSLTPGKQVHEGVLWQAMTEYANRHDQGTNGMPQRQFMWLSQAAAYNLAQQMLNFVKSKG